MHDQRMKRGDSRQLEFGERGVMIIELMHHEAAISEMDRNGKVEIPGKVVERVKIGIRYRAFIFERPHENAAGAVFLGEFQLASRLFEG